MKRRRGRPKGKKFPPTEDIWAGMYNVVYGKPGSSETLRLLKLCWHADFADLKPLHKKTSCKTDRPLRWQAQINEWKREIGTIVWQRILTCDDEFFRQLADVLEKMFKADQPKEYFSPRFLALFYKMHCDRERRPFKEAILRNLYKEYNHEIHPRTVSRYYRWAKGARWHETPPILAPLIMQQPPTSYIHPLLRPVR